MNQIVKKDFRRRGRPRNFDEAEVLQRAINVFWTRGYDGTTIDHLVEGMGMCRPSLYSTFGDKAALFMKCLEAYRHRLSTLAFAALEAPQDIRGAIHSLLRFTVEDATGEGSPAGCLMVCIAPQVEDEHVRSLLTEGGKQAVAAVERRLQEGVDSGELPPGFPVAVRARQTMDLSRGLTLRARIGASRNELLADAEEGANLILFSAWTENTGAAQLHLQNLPQIPNRKADERP